MSTVKPFLKWVGGKSQIIEQVLELFPNEMQNYHEPFLGGGSVLLAFLSRVKDGSITLHGTVYASDINAILIALYKNIQTRLDELLVELQVLVNQFASCRHEEVNRNATNLEEALTSQESYYFWIRSRFNALSNKTGPLASAMMLFMNKTCFRGVYREGPHGFNVPFGNYKNPTILDEDHLRQVSKLIQNVVFTCQSFVDSMIGADANDFLYLDPPYAPESATSFVSYTADGFNKKDHETLFQLCHETPARFLLSNANVPLVRDAFPTPPYVTTLVSCRRAIHSKKPDSVTMEVLVSNRRET